MKKIYCIICVVLLSATAAMAQNLPYQNSSLSPAGRAADLLPRLSLDEKISLMMDVSPAVQRLGIRPYNWWNEALHGVARAGKATMFPQAIGMAATFDCDAVEKAFGVVSDEARAKFHDARRRGVYDRYYGLTFWTPNVNIFRDPRWGRGQETYGEDPYLTSRMGVAVVKGLQGTGQGLYDKSHACAKHFAVHSGPEWNRHSFNAENIEPRDLWETYLPAFEALVKEADVKEVMCAYNRFEGVPCCGSNRLLVQILRDEWGYDGIVVSDCGAISNFYVQNRHETHPSAEAASADAVITGTDLECGDSYRSLGEAVSKGLITEEQIDKSVFRLLKARFELGEMDDDSIVAWSRISMDTVCSPKHRAMSLDMARKSMTLLQNNGILPLAKSGKKIAVMGPNANDSVMQWGNYNGTPAHTVTILEGIRNKIGDVPYEKGCEHTIQTTDVGTYQKIAAEAVAKVQDADIVIFVGGISPALEGEEMPVDYPGFRGGDRTDIELPFVQRQLIAALKVAGKKVVFVNCSGSAIALEPESFMCDAILQAWYPGEEGGTAVADVLFGDYNPAGRLPVTFYRNITQLPNYEDYNMAGRTYRYMREKPLFPFGHGLSYTKFRYGKPVLSSNTLKAGDELHIELPVSNTGSRSGDEVVQIYIRKRGDKEAPVKTLRAFRRVSLDAGETKNVKMTLASDAFRFFDAQTNTMRVVPGDYDVMCGGSSDRNQLKTVKVRLH